MSLPAGGLKQGYQVSRDTQRTFTVACHCALRNRQHLLVVSIEMTTYLRWCNVLDLFIGQLLQNCCLSGIVQAQYQKTSLQNVNTVLTHLDCPTVSIDKRLTKCATKCEKYTRCSIIALNHYLVVMIIFTIMLSYTSNIAHSSATIPGVLRRVWRRSLVHAWCIQGDSSALWCALDSWPGGWRTAAKGHGDRCCGLSVLYGSGDLCLGFLCGLVKHCIPDQVSQC